jgi:hypothetical protein
MSASIVHLTVRLVSPTLVGGDTSKKPDNPSTLRPPSVRGALRFWARALSTDPRGLESDLFGSTEKGQRVGILSPSALPARWRNFTILAARADGRHRRFDADVLVPGQQATLRFRLPSDLSVGERQKLAAVAWTWLHLGGIGLRSRRGLGSLLWVSKSNDLIESGERNLQRPPEVFASRTALENHLRSGLETVGRILARPATHSLRASSDWFRLGTINQVFVGAPAKINGGLPIDSKSGWEAVIQRLHGMREEDRGASNDEKLQMGKAGRERLASPMLWRVFRCEAPDGQLCVVPVLTWSPIGSVTRLTPRTPMARYLTDNLGFNSSLAGAPIT